MYKDKSIIAIIPARSGSKGLADKNIRELNGKPLLAYTIEAAAESKCFDYILVSTDSEKYAQIAKQHGAQVPFLRSKKNSSDKSSSWSVCQEVLEKLEKKFDIVVLLQPTSPLRTAQDIKKALNLFFEKNADTVVSVAKLDHPVEWCNYLPSNLSLNNFIKKEHKHTRRQDLLDCYRLNGAVFILKSDLIKPDVDLFSENSYAYIMDELRSIDIDSEKDFVIAQALFNCMD